MSHTAPLAWHLPFVVGRRQLIQLPLRLLGRKVEHRHLSLERGDLGLDGSDIGLGTADAALHRAHECADGVCFLEVGSRDSKFRGSEGEVDLEHPVDLRNVDMGAVGVDADIGVARLDIDVGLGVCLGVGLVGLGGLEIETGPRSREVVENGVDVGSRRDRPDPIQDRASLPIISTVCSYLDLPTAS